MASRRDIKRRITSVQSTRKITKAMEMMAAARLRRAQQRIEATRPYALRMMEFIGGLSQSVDPEIVAAFPLLQDRDEVKREALVALTADRGLCGAFNTNVVRRTMERQRHLKSEGIDADLIVVGKKGAGTLRFAGYELDQAYTGITDRPAFTDASAIAFRLSEMYVGGQVDRVVLIFNHFKSALEQRLEETVILPIQQEVVEGLSPAHAGWHMDFLYEPSAEELLHELLPSYLEMAVYRALLESSASEHGARMTAMRNASESAGEMIDALTLQMNRARQASITQEILEVVAGAEALQ